MEGESSVLGKRKAEEMENNQEKHQRSSNNDPVASTTLNLSLVVADDGVSTNDSNDYDDGDIKRDETECIAKGSKDLLHKYDKDSKKFDEDDTGPPEREMEEQQHSIGESPDGQVTIRVWLGKVDDKFKNWTQTIHVNCSYDGKIIGGGLGRHVNKNRIRSNFWRDMEEPNEELSSLAFEVFDRYGRLKQEFKEHPVRKGTGAWGSELDLGSLFIIEQVYVDRSCRRNSIGKLVVDCLMRKSRDGGRMTAFTLVAPGWLTSDIGDDIVGKTKRQKREIRYHAHDVAVSFFRAIGFRRIGASSCFGLAVNLKHRAHRVRLVADFDPSI